MIHSLHKVARNEQLVVVKKKNASSSTSLADPDTFPISNLSEGLLDESVSLWEERKHLKMKAGAQGPGFILEQALSSINHHESGNGVFIQCAPDQPQVIPPGTVLGFYPGIINKQDQQRPNTPMHSMDSYLKRYDGYWIDPEGTIAYPYRGVYSMVSQNKVNLSTWTNTQAGKKQASHFLQTYGKDQTDVFMVEGRDINPYALGHMINHPPPDTPANCIFIDLDLPFTFFTAEYSRYLPYMYEQFPTTSREESSFHHEVYRGVVILSKSSIASGEELFVDYLQDERVPFYTQPDWLIAPPPDPKYLTKQHYFHELGKLEQYLEKKELESQGEMGIEFLQRTSRLEGEQPKPLIESKKKFQALIESKQKNLIGEQKKRAEEKEGNK